MPCTPPSGSARPPSSGRPRWWGRVLAGLIAVQAGLTSLPAAIVYWDTNGTTNGTGTTPTGTWSTGTARWGNIGGTSTPVNWVSGNDAVFSAGTNGINAYLVTVTGTVNVSSVTIEEGTPTFTGSAITFNDATPDFTVGTGLTTTVNSDIAGTNGLTKAGTGTLILGTSDKTYTGTTTISAGTLQTNFNQTFGTVSLGGGTLALNSATTTITTLNLTANSTIDFSSTVNATLNLTTLNLNGFTLGITNWTAAADHFFATNWTGATLDVMGSAPMNLVTVSGFTSSQTGWDSFDHQIRPNVPEPGTYGAILLGALGGLFGWRQLMRRPATYRAQVAAGL